MSSIAGFGFAPFDETHDLVFVYWVKGFWKDGRTRSSWKVWRKPGPKETRATVSEVTRSLAAKHKVKYMGQVEAKNETDRAITD
jgi:hypothetical protein